MLSMLSSFVDLFTQRATGGNSKLLDTKGATSERQPKMVRESVRFPLDPTLWSFLMLWRGPIVLWLMFQSFLTRRIMSGGALAFQWWLEVELFASFCCARALAPVVPWLILDLWPFNQTRLVKLKWTCLTDGLVITLLTWKIWCWGTRLLTFTMFFQCPLCLSCRLWWCIRVLICNTTIQSDWSLHEDITNMGILECDPDWTLSDFTTVRIFVMATISLRVCRLRT
jgi:hypothetical protein